MNSKVKIIFPITIIVTLVISLVCLIYQKTQFVISLQDNLYQNNAKIIFKQYVDDILPKRNNLTKEIIDQTASNHESNNFYLAIQNWVNMIPVLEMNIYNQQNVKFFSKNKFDVFDLNHLTPETAYFNQDQSWFDKAVNRFSCFLIEDTNQELAFSKAQLGMVVSQTYINGSYIRLGEKLQKAKLVQIVIPIKDETTNKVIELIELFYDVTDQYSMISKAQLITIILILLLVGIFIVACRYIYYHFENLLAREHEITNELFEAKVRAENENSEKSKFLANISHELRTPLNAIIGFSEIIRTEALGPIGHPQYKDYINDINNSGTHLLSLINDILDYSKAEAEKLKVEAIELDVNKILYSSMRLVKPRAESAKVQLFEEIPKETVALIADPKRLKQAILNLLSNSVKFTPEGGKVTLSLMRDETNSQIKIQIKDTGIGIAEKDISKAMSMFGQIDNKLSRKYEGTGLGLPLTKKLVELMNGDFSLKSELGFGTTVTLIFPINNKADNQILAKAEKPKII